MDRLDGWLGRVLTLGIVEVLLGKDDVATEYESLLDMFSSAGLVPVPALSFPDVHSPGEPYPGLGKLGGGNA